MRFVSKAMDGYVCTRVFVFSLHPSFSLFSLFILCSCFCFRFLETRLLRSRTSLACKLSSVPHLEEKSWPVNHLPCILFSESEHLECLISQAADPWDSGGARSPVCWMIWLQRRTESWSDRRWSEYIGFCRFCSWSHPAFGYPVQCPGPATKIFQHPVSNLASGKEATWSPNTREGKMSSPPGFLETVFIQNRRSVRLALHRTKLDLSSPTPAEQYLLMIMHLQLLSIASASSQPPISHHLPHGKTITCILYAENECMSPYKATPGK